MDQPHYMLDVVILFDGLLLLAISYYYKLKPPKKINEFYGFRTRRTMANQDIWDAANTRNARDLVFYSWVLLISGLLTWLFQVPYAIIIHFTIMLLGLAIAIYSTINYLDKHFDKNGKRKQ